MHLSFCSCTVHSVEKIVFTAKTYSTAKEKVWTKCHQKCWQMIWLNENPRIHVHTGATAMKTILLTKTLKQNSINNFRVNKFIINFCYQFKNAVKILFKCKKQYFIFNSKKQKYANLFNGFEDGEKKVHSSYSFFTC